MCTVRVCCYGRVNLFLCFKDCWAIFIINHVSYAEQTDIVFDSFSISFCWNVNEFHLLLSLHIKIELSTSTHKMSIENSVRMKREKSKSSSWSSNSSSSTKTRSVFMCVCLCIELSKNDIKAEYLIELKITWPQTKLHLQCMDVYIVRANDILIECLHALNCNYVASFLLRRVVGETKTINCLFADRLFWKKSKWWLTIV